MPKLTIKTDQAKYRTTDEYPDNLLLALGVVPSSDPDNHSQQIKGLEIAMQSLTAREREVIEKYFCELQTLTECAKTYNSTHQYPQECKKTALEKLKHPTRLALIAYGPDAVKYYEQLQVEMKTIQDQIDLLQNELHRLEDSINPKYKKRAGRKINLDKKKEWATIPIDELEIPVRARSRLNRSEIYTLYDLSQYTRKDLRKIRQLGEISISEIVKEAAKYGLYIMDGE